MMKELKNLQDSVEQIEKLYSDYDDMMLLIEMSQEDADEETVQGIEEELEQFEKTFEELRISTLLTGPYDKDNAIVTLHAGAGGTESCDWRVCFTVCIPDGRRRKATLWKSWTTWKGTLPGSKA